MYKRQAVREVAANMGQNLGTTISITNQSAGDQLLSELGRGAIQGLSLIHIYRITAYIQSFLTYRNTESD